MPVHSKGNQSWVFIGRNDAKAETPILWPPHAKSWLIGKDSDAGRDWEQEETGTTEGEMAGWHHWLDGHEFEWTQGIGDGQGGLACWDSWSCKDSDTTELNWTELRRWVKTGLLPVSRLCICSPHSPGSTTMPLTCGLASSKQVQPRAFSIIYQRWYCAWCHNFSFKKTSCS